MKVNWSLVSLDHIRQACEMHDSGAAQPKRPAQSTFLVFNGKIYPAKFIRGLAYKLATGMELDPSREYAGGAETVRFFEGLGLTTRHEPLADAEESAISPPLEAESPIACEAPRLAIPRTLREPQKRSLADVLRRRFGAVELEAQFPWLSVPDPSKMDVAIRSIYEALQTMRGYSNFASLGKSLCCDFSIPSERLVIEYDEKQHFTLQRAKALELYTEDRLGFDRQEWITACRSIHATDPMPPYRDEQRAFYDSLRDILAARNGVRLLRLRYGSFDWRKADADEEFNKVLSSNPKAGVVRQFAVSTAPTVAYSAADQISRVALVSHDYNVADSSGLYDYSEHFARINKLCDEQGCDTILYALYTWDQDSTVARTHAAIFGGLAHMQRVIIEVGKPAEDRFDHVEVWLREQEAPVMAHQRFATSSSSNSSKQAFMDDLQARQIKDGLLVICGETNIASTIRGAEEFYDPYDFVDRLRQMKIRLVLNPIHDYMTRYEMRKKRRQYSLDGRMVISVWNQGRGKESAIPWTVFHDGEEKTDAVRELPTPFSDRPDIRIGILDVKSIALFR